MSSFFNVFSAKVTGPSHHERQVGCEDFLSIKRNAKGTWLAAVVCDGCGSAPKAMEGAEFIAEFMSKGLLEITEQLDELGPGEWLIDEIVVLVAQLRKTMRQKLPSPLNDYAATIVAALVNNSGGFIFHIGDGIGTVFSLEEKLEKPVLSVTAQSEPENGEYANVTFYPTEPSWIKHIRLTPITSWAAIFLGTDGSQEILYDGNQFSPPSMSQIIMSLIKNPDRGNRYLEQVLDAQEAQKLSSDDKAAIIIVNEKLFSKLETNANWQLDEGSSIQKQRKRDEKSSRASRDRVGVSVRLPDGYKNKESINVNFLSRNKFKLFIALLIFILISIISAAVYVFQSLSRDPEIVPIEDTKGKVEHNRGLGEKQNNLSIRPVPDFKEHLKDAENKKSEPDQRPEKTPKTIPNQPEPKLKEKSKGAENKKSEVDKRPEKTPKTIPNQPEPKLKKPSEDAKSKKQNTKLGNNPVKI